MGPSGAVGASLPSPDGRQVRRFHAFPAALRFLARQEHFGRIVPAWNFPVSALVWGPLAAIYRLEIVRQTENIDFGAHSFFVT